MTPANQDVLDRPRPAVRVGRRFIFVKRVSQRHGREGERFMSPEQQTDLVYDYVRSTGDTIIDVVDETDTVSGGSVDRAGLQDALRRCLKGEADGVIVANVRRFARTRRAGEAAIYGLIENEKSFVAVKERIDSGGTKLDRMSEKWLNDVLMNAQWEREDAQDNWKDVTRRHIAQGRAAVVSYGYRKGKDGRLVIYEPEARWVRFIFDRRAAGKKWSWIVNELNRKRVHPPRPRSEKTTPSVHWMHQHLTYIVNNRVYLGELRRGEFVNLTAHKPIITLAAWGNAHAIRAVAGRSDRHVAFFLLRGLVRCASCGGRMKPELRLVKATGEMDRYYRCGRKYSWGVCKRPAMVRADELEEATVEFFEEAAMGWYTTTSRKLNETLDVVRAELAEATAELQAFTLATRAASAEVGGDVFAAGLAERADRVRAAQEAERAARSSALGGDLPVDLAGTWADHDDDARAAVIGRVIYCVAVKPSKVAKRPDPARGRMKIWVLGDHNCPTLPGRRIGKRPREETPTPNAITPIEW